MDDRNKDLPLIVSEILIEMHEMKEDIREMKNALNRMASVILKQQEHTNSLFVTIQEENRKNMQFVGDVLTTVQRENKQNIEAIRQEGKDSRDFMIYSLNKATGQQQQANKAFDERLTQLEQKFN